MDNTKMCVTCIHYDFEDESQQICKNENNHQFNNDNELNEDRWYQMMVTPDFGCNEWKSCNE